jgi:HAD superfamily hydrolase (TIGR01456 family)
MRSSTNQSTQSWLSDGGLIGTKAHPSSYTGKPSIPIYFANNDLLWANNYSLPRLGQGAYKIVIDSLYRAMTGHELESTVIGKPYRLTYAYADKMLANLSGGQSPDKVFMIGDNPASDIAGAVAYGWDSVLVRTGVYKNESKIAAQPTSVQDSVIEAVDFGLQRAAV